jgi:hypothetical protein
MISNTIAPSYGSAVLLKPSGSLRSLIEQMLLAEECNKRVWPYFANGSITGHKVMDVGRAVTELRKYDAKNGNKLSAFSVNDFQLGNALKNAIRARWVLGRDWKVSGVNGKRAMLLAAPTDAVAGEEGAE